MTREQWKERLPFITAFAEGKDVRVRMRSGKWTKLNEAVDVDFTGEIDRYHIGAPTRIVPWTAETCPPGWVRRKNCLDEEFFILGKNSVGIYLFDFSSPLRYDTILQEWEYQRSDGTWGPCGIEVTPLQKAPDIT